MSKIIKILRCIWESSSVYYFFKGFENLDDAAGGTIYNPESLKNLDKSDEFIKSKRK